MSRRATAECLGVTPSTVAERAAWQALQPGIEIDRQVLIDETGASTKMARLNGRSPRGTRCFASMRAATGKRRRFVDALGTTGLAAPIVLDGPMDAGDITVMDNLPAQKLKSAT